jgi:hypothetical protein
VQLFSDVHLMALALRDPAAPAATFVKIALKQ